MVCVVCSKDFEAKRATAKFCSDGCRVKFFRNAKPTPEVTVTSEADMPGGGVPNWQRNGFPDRERSILYSIMISVKRDPGVVVTWQGRSWSKDDFSSDQLKELEPLF